MVLFGNISVNTVSASSAVVERAIDWAIAIANDNTHGYSQKVRWGPDYDCSSFVISAFKNAGVDTGSASYTGDMRTEFIKHGFSWIPWSNINNVNNLIRGDVLLKENSHTEIYLGGNQIIGAHQDRGYPQTGDQPGNEISVCGFYIHPWDGILRYNDNIIFPGDEDTSYAVPVILKAKQKDNTYNNYGNIESGHWIDAGDDCYVEKVYKNGFCWVEYPSGSERRWAYAKVKLFDIPKKNSSFPGAEDTSYAVPAQLNAVKKDNTYDDNGNMESGHWIDAGDSCYVEKVYVNGFCRVRYPAGSEQRWAYAKANVFNIPKKNSGFPGSEDTSYAVPVRVNANQKDNTYDNNGNVESGHWIDAGDSCYIEKVYTNGFCRVQYPAGSEQRWAYAKASIFSIPKKNSGFPGTEDTSYSVPVWLNAKYHDNTYDGNGNVESNRWIDAGDNCYIDKVYQNGFCHVEYPAGSQRRWAYAKASLFDLPKTHNYSTSVIAPTCTEQGYTLHKCSHCGDSYKDNYQSALGHNYQLSSQKAATCIANGEKVYKCSRCGVTKTEAIDATGHSYTTKVVAPTCTAQGYTLHTCSKCNNSYKDTYTYATGHNYGSWTTTKEATCTEKGSKTRKCQTCDNTETSEIAATGHSYTTKVVDPTCTAQGYTLHTCSKCNNSYKDTYTNATGHNYGSWTTTKEATCTEKGSKTRKCQTCGNTETSEIAATGHSYTTKVVAPTCTAQGYTLHTCSKCNNSYKDTYTNATGHNYGSWTTTKEATCTEKGSKTRKCQSCGYTEIDEIATTSHNYTIKVIEPTEKEQGYTLHTCSGCGDNYITDYTDPIGNIDPNMPSIHVSGDINNDGKVNMKDVTRLHQYVNGWDVMVDKSLIDVNGDGKVNMKDVTRLHQYVNGWDVNIT